MRYVKAPGPEGYDYVVIGSGSAGAVMATRLAEDQALRVLVVEAGGSDRRLGIMMPAALGLPLLSDRTNWKLYDQRARDGGVYTPRGKVLGGSSSVNGMNWMRGNREDYDSWAELGAGGWSYDDVLPFFKQAERFEDGESDFRGGHGPVAVERAAADHALFEAFFKAGDQAGHAHNADHNAQTQLGMHRIQRNVGAGRRQNTSYCYLRQGTADNVDVLSHTRAEALMFEGTRCVGVRLRCGGKAFEVRAAREVVVSAGALMSPQLLMLSGIGAADMLRGHGISVVLDQPEVGRGLSDHTCLVMDFAVRDEAAALHRVFGWAGLAAMGATWLATRRGLGASNWFEAGAMVSTTGAARPDMQVECVAMRPDFGPDAITVAPGYHCAMSLQRPDSVGHVTLGSSDPSAAPLFEFGYLQTQHDQDLAVAAIKALREIMAQPAAHRVFGAELGGSEEARSDADILAWAEASAESNYHPSCTLAMGRVTDTVGRVMGVEGVRVVDASILPVIPSANLNAPVIMMAEKIAASMREG